MSKLDMSGVNPLRWAEVRRRVDVVTSYLEIPHPTDADRKQYASKLGLRVTQFLALVRAWQVHKRASAIAGSGAAKGQPRATGPRHLPEAVKVEARRIVDELGPDATLKEAKLRITASMAARGWQVPSSGTIHNMLMRKRQERCGASGDDVIIIGQCWAELAIQQAGELAYPTVLLAVGASSGAVLAAASAASKEADVGSRLFDALGQLHKSVLVDEMLSTAALDLPGISLVAPEVARSHLARTLGYGIGSMRLIYRPSRDPSRLLRSLFDEALNIEDAEEVIGEHVRKHNEARGAAAAAWLARHHSGSAKN